MVKIVIKKGYATAERQLSHLPEKADIEYIETTSDQIDPAALDAIPEQVMRDFTVFPLNRSENALRLALGDPAQMSSLDKFRIISSMEIVPVLVPADEIRELINERFPAGEKGPGDKQGEKLEDIIEEVRRLLDRASAVDLVNEFIRGAIRTRATDIHFDPQEDNLRVRYRIDGALYDIIALPRRLEAGLISRLKVLCNMDITNTRTPQDGHFMTRFDSRNYDLRVATVPAYFGEKIVLRFIGGGSVIKNLKQLGMDPADERVVDRFVKRRGGFLLVTGPMGSGKTTTLYAVLNGLNVLAENIVTIEDPVEFQLKGVNQIQVNKSADLSYSQVLRGALRLDIDTLMVGEIRDDESAHIAVRAAVTGHRVLSTMHTNNALETITAMRHMGIKSFMIASALNVVIAQRLVRVNCTRCKEPYEPPKDLLAELALPQSAGPFFQGKGCPYCNYTGFYGRVGIFEVLKVDDDIKAKIVAGVSVDEIARTGAAENVKFLIDRSAQKVAAGMTTAEEALRSLGA